MSDPFVLTPEQLVAVEVTLAYHSPKTGAGRQELVVGGAVEGKKDGVLVRLRRTASREAPLDERQGVAPRDAFERLLALFAEEGFLALDQEYPAPPPPRGKRSMQLVLPDHDHCVFVAYPTPCAEFERLAGATKLVAALALPEALGHAFFVNL